MADPSITSSRELLECPICLEQFQVPRSLPCLHSFCEECLNSYISSQVGKTTDFPCPLCRTIVILPNPKSLVGSWAQTFPLNHLIVTLMDGGMENKDDVTCTLCHVRDSSSVKAIYWCNDCSEGLCEKCYTYHQSSKFRSKHNSGLIGAIIIMKTHADIDEDCPRHRGKILEVYCSEHSELCCVVCFATQHRECKKICSIDDVSEGFNVDDVCSKFTCEMKNIEQEMLMISSIKETNIIMFEEEMKVIISEITDAVDKAKANLDSARDTFKSEVTHKYETEKQKLMLQQKRVQAFEKDVNNCRKVMMSVISGTRRQQFVMLEKMKSQLISHYHQLKSELANDVHVDMEFRISRPMAALGTCSLTSLGNIDVNKVPSSQASDIMIQIAKHLNKLSHSSV